MASTVSGPSPRTASSSRRKDGSAARRISRTRPPNRASNRRLSALRCRASTRCGPKRRSSATYSRSSLAFSGSAGGPGIRRHRRGDPILGLILLLQTLSIAVSGPATSAEYLPLRVAEAEGYFAREGLAVTLRTTRAEVGAAEALAQGQVDLAATSVESILRFGPRLASQAPRLVLGLTAAPPVVLLVADAHKTIVRSIDDLPGTRIGVSTPGAPEQAWFAWLLARAGLSVAQMWLVSRGARGVG